MLSVLVDLDRSGQVLTQQVLWFRARTHARALSIMYYECREVIRQRIAAQKAAQEAEQAARELENSKLERLIEGMGNATVCSDHHTSDDSCAAAQGGGGGATAYGSGGQDELDA